MPVRNAKEHQVLPWNLDLILDLRSWLEVLTWGLDLKSWLFAHIFNNFVNKQTDRQPDTRQEWHLRMLAHPKIWTRSNTMQIVHRTIPTLREISGSAAIYLANKTFFLERLSTWRLVAFVFCKEFQEIKRWDSDETWKPFHSLLKHNIMTEGNKRIQLVLNNAVGVVWRFNIKVGVEWRNAIPRAQQQRWIYIAKISSQPEHSLNTVTISF